MSRDIGAKVHVKLGRTVPGPTNKPNQKLETLRTLCQKNSPKTGNYWSKDISHNYDSFCLLRKYRKDAEKIKEHINRLEKDRLSLRHLWNQAEAYNNYIQNTKLGNRKKTLSIKARTNAAQVQRVKMGGLVPPPKTPDLAFLAPKLITEIDLTSNDPSLSAQNEAAGGKVPGSARRTAKGNIGTKKTWDKSETLEIVTSYMPESKPKLKSKFTMRSERPTLDQIRHSLTEQVHFDGIL